MGAPPWTKSLASSKSCMHVKRQSVVCVLLLLGVFFLGGGGGLGKDHRARKLSARTSLQLNLYTGMYTLSVVVLYITSL